MKKFALCLITAVLAMIMAAPVYAGEWIGGENNSSWMFRKDDGSNVVGSWYQVEGDYYYFDNNGIMLSNTVTPDGYRVDVNGKWLFDLPPQYANLDYMCLLIALESDLTDNAKVKLDYSKVSDAHKVDMIEYDMRYFTERYECAPKEQHSVGIYLQRDQYDKFLQDAYNSEDNDSAIDRYISMMEDVAYPEYDNEGNALPGVDEDDNILLNYAHGHLPAFTLTSTRKVNDHEIELSGSSYEPYNPDGTKHDQVTALIEKHPGSAFEGYSLKSISIN